MISGTIESDSGDRCPTGAKCGDPIKGEYIVLLQPNVSADEVWTSHASLARKVKRVHSFTGQDFLEVPAIRLFESVNGMLCHLTKKEADELAKDKNVKVVEPNRVVSLSPDELKAKDPPKAFDDTKQTIPYDIQRIGDTDENSPAHIGKPGTPFNNVNVAVIDTGIDLTHPDLNVTHNVSFVAGAKDGNDDQGHGTHCAGAIGAIDNNIGVVGVAPGVNLWAVKVLNSKGSGTLADIISGVDYVTANANQIKVASCSFGFEGHSEALDEAINKSIDAGVTYCIAAGNSGKDLNEFSPASNARALTVTAFGDGNGLGPDAGQVDPSCRTQTDDAFAEFSCFGPKKNGYTITAPGVCNLSTYKGGTYKEMSGTSMATPLVAGAAALFIASHPNASPSEVIAALIGAGAGYDEKVQKQNGKAWTHWGITGDPYQDERVLNVIGL